jgi:hypothetical protein
MEGSLRFKKLLEITIDNNMSIAAEENPFQTRAGTTGMRNEQHEKSSFRLSPPPTRVSEKSPFIPPQQQQLQQQQQQQQLRHNTQQQHHHYQQHTTINTIDVAGKGLSSLDDVILGETTCNTLLASHNSLLRLRAFPLKWQTTLTTLDLSSNRLVMLKEATFRALTGLQDLNLSNNSLSSLPSLKTCDQLHTLRVSRNNLTSFDGNNIFPSSNTVTVKVLDLSENSLSFAPSLDGCVALEELNIRMNLIPSLPRGFAGPRLRVLLADVNAFATLDHLIAGLLGSRLENMDVRNNPFVATVERYGSEYRSILVCAIPSLVSISGRPVTDRERSMGQQLSERQVTSYDALIADVKRASGSSGGGSSSSNRSSNNNSRGEISRNNIPPPSPAAGSEQAKQWALSMLQSQQKDAMRAAAVSGSAGSSSSGAIATYGSPSPAFDPRLQHQRTQMQRLQRMDSPSKSNNTRRSHSTTTTTTTLPTMDRRSIENALFPTAAAAAAAGTSATPQPLGTLVNVTKEVTRLRNEVSVMRKYIRHWILKESAMRIKSATHIQATVRGWSDRRALRRSSSTYRRFQRKRMRRLLDQRVLFPTLPREAIFFTTSAPLVLRWLWSSDYPTLDDVTSCYDDDVNVFVKSPRWTRFDDAATNIQRITRGVFCRQRLRTALDMSWNAVIIQSWWRGAASRFPKEEREKLRDAKEKEGMATVADVIALAKIVSRQSKTIETLEREKQTESRAMELLWKEVHALKQEKKRQDETTANNGATSIQSTWRSYVSRKETGEQLRDEKEKRKRSAEKIQANIRGVVARLRLSKELKRKQKGEAKISTLEHQISELHMMLRRLLAQQHQHQHQHQHQQRRGQEQGQGQRQPLRRRRRRKQPIEKNEQIQKKQTLDESEPRAPAVFRRREEVEGSLSASVCLEESDEEALESDEEALESDEEGKGDTW